MQYTLFILTTTLALLSLFATVSLAQSSANVTVRDIDPRVAFSPLCSPRNKQCSGGWFNYNFTATQSRTMTFGPSAENRNVQPSATFTFNGTAIYYYAITSGRTATVSISLDGGTAQNVNLTVTDHLNTSSGIYFPAFAWSATQLDPNKQHTFYLEFAEPDAWPLGKWAGFDSIVYTPSTPVSITPTSTALTTITAGPVSSGHHVSSGVIIGSVFAGTFVALVLVVGLVWYCVKKREKPIGAPPPEGWAIDGTSLRTRRRSNATRIHSVYQGVNGGPAPPTAAMIDPFRMSVHPALESVPETVPLPDSPTTHTDRSASRRNSRIAPSSINFSNTDSIAMLVRQQQEIIELLRQQGVVMSPTGDFSVIGSPDRTSSNPFSLGPFDSRPGSFGSMQRSQSLGPSSALFSPTASSLGPQRSTSLGAGTALHGFSPLASTYASPSPATNTQSLFEPTPIDSTPRSRLSWIPDQKVRPPSTPPFNSSSSSIPSSPSLSATPLRPDSRGLPDHTTAAMPIRPLPVPQQAIPLPPIPQSPASPLSGGGLHRSNTVAESVYTFRTGPPAYTPN